MTDAAPHLGCRSLDVHDAVQGARVPARVLYPTAAAPRTVSFGAYAIDLAIDGPVLGAPLPLVAVSHGGGGTPWAYRALAAHLARGGFAVLLLEHPGNTRGDDGLANTAANLANRPRHVRLAIDEVFADAALAPHLAPGGVAVIGHSIGATTALCLAGGRPLALPQMTADGVAHPVEVERDPRVRAVVLLAPALPWLMAPGALADVRVPVLARTGERDELAPPSFVAPILSGLPAEARLDHRVVAGAGHFFAFWPVPQPLIAAGLPPALDPPGFDRAAYQPTLYGEVAGFLRAALA